jgi:Flp pilus assembly protein TadD
MRKALGLIALWVVLPAGTATAQLQGRVILSGAEQADVLVSVETLNGQIVHQVYTSSRGNFRLEGVRISAANPMYLIVNEQGYKPFRQHIREQDMRGGAAFTVYLEREDTESRTPDDSDGTVDLRQLQADIPDAASREYTQAIEEAEDENWERAAQHLERAVALAPDFYDAWIDLGGQYDRLGRYDAAEAAFVRATEVNPAGALALVNLGVLFYQRGERERGDENTAAGDAYSLAENWLRQAIDLNPAAANARSYLGAVLYRQNRLTESEDMLRSAIALDAAYVDAQLMLINVFARQRRYDAALEQAVAFLEDHPDAPEREAIERVRSQIEAALGQ